MAARRGDGCDAAGGFAEDLSAGLDVRGSDEPMVPDGRARRRQGNGFRARSVHAAAAVPETGEGKRARLGLLKRVAASAALGLQELTAAELTDLPALSACDAQAGRPS